MAHDVKAGSAAAVAGAAGKASAALQVVNIKFWRFNVNKVFEGIDDYTYNVDRNAPLESLMGPIRNAVLKCYEGARLVEKQTHVEWVIENNGEYFEKRLRQGLRHKTPTVGDFLDRLDCPYGEKSRCYEMALIRAATK